MDDTNPPDGRTPMHELEKNRGEFPCESAYNVAYGIAASQWDSPRLGGTSPSAVAAGAMFLGLVLASDDPDIDAGGESDNPHAGPRRPQTTHDYDISQEDICDVFGLSSTATVVSAHRILTRVVCESVDEPHPYLKEMKPIADEWAEGQDGRVA